MDRIKLTTRNSSKVNEAGIKYILALFFCISPKNYPYLLLLLWGSVREKKSVACSSLMTAHISVSTVVVLAILYNFADSID